MGVTMNPPQRLALKLSDVASQVGICTRTVQRLVHAGKFPQPTAWAGKRPLWTPESVQAWCRGEWRPEAKAGQKKVGVGK
jgi:predicted DNA-binding transcriptional regulator AlpA